MKILKNNQWTCNNQCGSNCCSSIYLEVDDKQIHDLEKYHSFEVPNDYTDWKWLEYHPGLEVKRISDKIKVIFLFLPFEIVTNPYINKRYVYMKTKCHNLLPSNKCKVYRRRPEACRYGLCIWKNNNPIIEWFGRDLRGEILENWNL